MAENNFEHILEMIDELENLRDELQDSYDAEKSLRWENRRWLRHPFNEGRLEGEGFYHTTFQELKQYPEKFKSLTRMTPETFDYLLRLVQDYVGPKRNTRDAIPAEHRLAVTLTYLAHGSQIALLALDHKIAPATLYKIIPETCEGIFNALSSQYLRFPERAVWRNIAKGYNSRWQLPGCMSAVDGKHVHIRAPDNSGTVFFNFKKSFSMVLMAAVNHNYEISWVDFGAYGIESDGGIFSRSEFGKAFENQTSNIPVDQFPLPNSNLEVPYYFVGDDAFKLRKDFMKPYKGNNLTEPQKVFNYRLSRGRRCVESAFGILVMRWRLLERAVGLRPEQIHKIVEAAVCLHNFLSSLNLNEDEELIRQYDEQQRRNRGARQRLPPNLEQEASGYEAREFLTEYFNSREGEVAWQYERVRRGQRDLANLNERGDV